MDRMKVLWFTVTPSLYDENRLPHKGGGWIASLEALVRKVPDIELGVAFEHSDTCFKIKHENVNYYPINVWQSIIKKIKKRIFYKTEEELIISACLKVILDFKPDIIHVFGSEWCFGLITNYINIPVVIHMQGSIPPYYNARFPSGYSKSDFLFYYGFNILKTFWQIRNDLFFLLRAKREERILQSCKYFMGRTDWDKSVTKIYNPNSNYYYCSEVLRKDFYCSNVFWQPHKRECVALVTTISSPLYKGSDLILKTAKILMENFSIDFEWRVFGIQEMGFQEWKSRIKASEVNVKLMGAVSAEKLKDELLNADIFIHPSYIDNSPNSVCEAQILGLPVISTNVGGLSSLIDHKKNGILIPANDPYMLATYIKSLSRDRKFASELGMNARMTALNRHDTNQIITDLYNIYKKIIECEKSN